MKKVYKKKSPDGKKEDGRKVKKKILSIEDTVSSYSDESTPRRYRNPISQRWDDTASF